MSEPQSFLGEPYELVSVRRAKAPPGTDEPEWHRYVIRQGSNTIRGCRQGTLAAVTEAVEEIVVKLNDRRVNKRGRTHIVLRGRKPAQK